MSKLTGPTGLFPGWDTITLSRGCRENYRVEDEGEEEVGGVGEDCASLALVTLFPKLYCKGNSPGWWGLLLDSMLLAGVAPMYLTIASRHMRATVVLPLAECRTATSDAEVSGLHTPCRTLLVLDRPVWRWLVAWRLGLCRVCCDFGFPKVATIE